MPDDDATVEWSANDARPIPVATIRIPQQRFDSRAQMEFAEAISFNPWRVTAEHAPLGRINFLRGAVYGAVATLRQQRLGAAWPPPALHDWSYFANSLLARKGSMPASRADPAPRADPASSIPP